MSQNHNMSYFKRQKLDHTENKKNAANKKVFDLILDMGLTNIEFYYDFSFVPPTPVCNYAQYINIIVQP